MKKESVKKKNKNLDRLLRYVLIACIFMYPFIHTFIGMDLGDTGYHLFAFENLYTQPEFLSFTSYFTNVIGYLWMKFFGGLGLWGLNLLEVGVEMLIAFIVYKIFAPWIGRKVTLAGILIAVLASDTYLNVFNYHQFNVLLITLIVCMEFKAVVKDKALYSCFAGLAFTAVVFSRSGSVTVFVTLVVYVLWYLFNDKDYKFILKHVFSFIGSAGVMLLGFVGLLFGTNQLQFYLDNVLRLKGLASGTGSYGIGSLLETFICGNLDAMASGCLFLTAFLFILIAITVISKNSDVKKRIVNVLVGVVLLIIGGYQLIYAYNVNPVPSWPQMTTGPSFTIGVMYVVAIACLLVNLYSEHGKIEIAFLTIISILLPLLTIAGSNTGTKHVILGMWMIAPICVYTIYQMVTSKEVLKFIHRVFAKISLNVKRGHVLIALGIVALAFFGKFGHMLYHTTNFDSVSRHSLNSFVDNDKVKWIRTTKNQADSVNGVLEELEKVDEDRPLMVFGGSLMFYAMTERESFVQPWVSNDVYDNELLKEDLKRRNTGNDSLPAVVYCRTNNYYGFYDEKYSTLINAQMSSDFGGKKQIFLDFLEDNKYKLSYANNYYVVLLPENLVTEGDGEYRSYMVYE